MDPRVERFLYQIQKEEHDFRSLFQAIHEDDIRQVERELSHGVLKGVVYGFYDAFSLALYLGHQEVADLIFASKSKKWLLSHSLFWLRVLEENQESILRYILEWQVSNPESFNSDTLILPEKITLQDLAYKKGCSRMVEILLSYGW